MVLLIVDTQKGITDERLYGFKELEENIKTLLKASRDYGVEVIYVRHDDGPGSGFSKGDDDFEIYDGFAPIDGEKIFDKKVNSAFHESTGLDAYLKSKNISTVIIVGLQTDYCVDATIKSGFEKGYKMIVPEYSNSTRSNAYMDEKTTYEFYNKNMWPGRYAQCLTVKETLNIIGEYKMSEASARINECGTQEIKTERLLLRPFRIEDAQSAMDNWAGDEAVQGMYGEPAYRTVEEVKSLLQKYISGYVTGDTYRWAVIEMESGECIGQIAYFLVDQTGSWGEIEYAIGTAYQGKGYATEATKAVIDYGFKNIGFHKVQICVRPSNIKSKRVIEKCGFEYEGTLRDYFFIDGKYEGRIYAALYQETAKKWVKAGAVSHAICLYEHDEEAKQQFFRYGFGMRCVDAIRPMETIECVQFSGYEFLELPKEDHAQVYPLHLALNEHYRSSPFFMNRKPDTLEEFLDFSERNEGRYFAAKIDGELCAYMEVSDQGETFIASGNTYRHITGAYCMPEHRGRGVYKNLLNYVINTLKTEGYARFGVDFESINPLGSRFWLKHFHAYTNSVVRRIDERIIEKK